MNQEQTANAIKVMECYAMGAEIEHRVPGQSGGWRPCLNPAWSWGAAEYRVRPPRIACYAVLNDCGIPVQCYVSKELADRHLAGNFNTPDWRVVRLCEV